MLTVFGSINVDISVHVARFPAPGETVLGGEAQISPGGKGANQAHAARLFGAPVAMVGAVGQDALAVTALASMRAAGIDLGHVQALAGVATGIATIQVAASAENSIVVAPGANGHVRAAWVDEALLRHSRGLLLQMEVPVAESMRVARQAGRLGCPVTLNFAPALSVEGVEFDAIGTLIVNETELASIAAATGTGGTDVAEQLARLATRWQIDVIATLGADGALLQSRDGSSLHQAAYAVDVIDTTGAGDTFTGVFCAARAAGGSLEAALRLAVGASALACTRRGAQVSQPTRSEIDRAMASL